jgi:hypothetical protein
MERYIDGGPQTIHSLGDGIICSTFGNERKEKRILRTKDRVNEFVGGVLQ